MARLPTRTRVPLRPPHRAPIAPPHARKNLSMHPDALYGYGYNPSRPSILNIAHDENDGGALFIIMDRPCVLLGTGLALPIIVPDDGGPVLNLVSSEMVLPVKLRVSFDGPVPQGSAWRYLGGACDLYDAITGHYPNAGAGQCVDFPGPYIPPPPPPVPANITSVVGNEGLASVAISFDRPIELAPGAVPDDAITFGDLPALSVTQVGPQTLAAEIQVPIVPFATPWAIYRQPSWIWSPVVFPTGDVIVPP